MFYNRYFYVFFIWKIGKPTGNQWGLLEIVLTFKF